MLERASTCLETGGRQLLRTSQSSLPSRRALHSSLWQHGAADVSLPAWLATLPPPIGDKACTKETKRNDGQLLDFLYPAMTLDLIRRLSIHRTNPMEDRRRHHVNGRSIRQYSTTRWKAGIADITVVDPKEKELQAEVEERLQGSSAADALQNILDSEEGKQELAIRLYLAIPVFERPPSLQADLLEYLAPHDIPVDANRILDIFSSLRKTNRRASSYRIAISANLALDMVGQAAKLHEEAAIQDIGMDIGTHLILGRAVRDNQWDLCMRIITSFKLVAERNGLKLSLLYPDPSRKNGEFKVVWGGVAQLPHLRTKLESALEHIKQLQHMIRATANGKEALQHFVFGLTAETTEQMLNAQPPDENEIWDFLVCLFYKLREIGLSKHTALYEYVIQRMLTMPRYKEYTNQRKVYLQLYRMYREECEQDPSKTIRPSQKLIRRLLVQAGSFGSVGGSTGGIDILVGDLRLFHPGERVQEKTLNYLINFYAGCGEVDKVNDYIEEYEKGYPGKLTIELLTALPYSYARRADVHGTEKQFKRISEEFGKKPDAACWNVLLHAYTRADDLDGALACFNRLLEDGVRPDRYTFGPLLDLCAARGDVEAYESIFSRAETLGIPVRKDIRSRASYVQALIKFDDYEGAEATALSMLDNVKTGALAGSLTHTWNLLLQYHATRGDLASTKRIYAQMTEHKIPLDSWTYGSLMRVLVEVRQTNAAYRILRVTMPSNNVQVRAFHYALVMTGFIREKEYAHAMSVHKRMVARNVEQTPSSRVASLQAIGATEILKLKESKDTDPKTRLIAVEESLREILLADYASEAAANEPRHNRLIDQRHNVPEGYFGFLILLYGTRGAYELAQELFKAATDAHEDEPDYEAPLSLLTAIMEAHFQAKEYDEIARCFKLAQAQAMKLIKTFHDIINPEAPSASNDSLLDPVIQNKHLGARVSRIRRRALHQATRIYISSLLMRRDIDGIPEAQRTIKELLMAGFEIDNITWNDFIQMLARRGRTLDAFTACEAYLIPSFPGWRNLRNQNYVRKDRPGFAWMELRHEEVRQKAMLPRYKTLVVLATAYAQVRKEEADGGGYNTDMGGWTRDLLETMCPKTISAIQTMPRTGDALQQQFLKGYMVF